MWKVVLKKKNNCPRNQICAWNNNKICIYIAFCTSLYISQPTRIVIIFNYILYKIKHDIQILYLYCKFKSRYNAYIWHRYNIYLLYILTSLMFVHLLVLLLYLYKNLRRLKVFIFYVDNWVYSFFILLFLIKKSEKKIILYND